MKTRSICHRPEHVSRRSFLQGAAGGALGMLGFHGMVRADGAAQLAQQQKQVVVFWLAGGVSQLETWDPKPGTDTGGPFQAIPTSVPGVHISELLPYTAQQMHRLAVVRSIDTKEGDHARGTYFMETGQKKTEGFDYPYLGSAFAKQLSAPDSPLPGYIHVGNNRGNSEAVFLGPRYAPLALPDGQGPKNLERPAGLAEVGDAERRALRARISQRFVAGRSKADTEAYNASHDQALQLMAKRDIFDFNKMPDKDAERYGTHDFGRHCRMALRLIENGITFVKVSHREYDTHSENFNFHLEQLGEFDRPFSTFMGDLADRGMLEHTLVIVMCEFGRTPRINANLGRDHWGNAWSIAMGGAGIKGGAVVGKTNANGTQVIDREVDGGHLFHTYYRAVGLDPTKNFYDNGRPVPKANPKAAAIEEILA